jgi:hypothetical protein
MRLQLVIRHPHQILRDSTGNSSTGRFVTFADVELASFSFAASYR